MAQSIWFLFQSQVYLPEDGATYNGLGPRTSIINQEKALRELPTVQSHGGIFLIEVTLQMTLVETSKQAKKVHLTITFPICTTSICGYFSIIRKLLCR